MWRRAGACALVLVVAFVSACSDDGSRPNLVAATLPTTTTTTEPPPPRAIGRSPDDTVGRELSGPDPEAFQTIVATASGDEVTVFDEPDGEVLDQLANPTASGGKLVFVVESIGEEWHRVRLPVAPVDGEGWIRADEVDLAAHDYRIEIDVDALLLRVYERTAVLLAAPIGIDPDDVPPPGPSTYITELLQSAEPNPVYGTYAYGLSGFAEEFETFTGAAGQFGIHGTTEPESIGVAAPAGSIRLADDDIEALVAFLPLGVIVEVT